MASSSDSKIAKIRELGKTARRHVEKGRMEEALAVHQELLRLEPDNVRNWLTLAYLEGKHGNREASARIFRKLGRYYTSHGETAKAITVYQQVLAFSSRETAVHLRLAALYLKENHSVESWNHCRAALALLLEEDRRSEAVTVLVSMTELQPENVVLWVRLGETAVSADLTDQAVDAFKRAMVLLQQRGRMEHYLRVAERVLGLTPDDLVLAGDLAAAYLEQGNVPAALTKLRPCYEANRRDTRTLHLLVDAFGRLGYKDKAINALRILADLYQAQGDAEQYQLTCQQLLELDPSQVPDPPVPRPPTARRSDPTLEQTPEQMLEQMSDQTPGQTPADKITVLINEAAGYAKIGLHDGAADALRQARILDPQHEQVFELLRSVYVQLGAENELVALLVDHAEGLVTSDRARATALLEEAEELNPDHPAVFRARIGPLDPLAEQVEPDEEGSAVHIVADQRWSGERSSMKLMTDITEVTVRKQMQQPDVTVKINVDGLEQTLLEEQQPQAEAPRADNPFDIRSMGAQPTGPRPLLTTGEIELSELRQVLEMDTEAD